MSISIPAIVDAQLLSLKNSIKPDYHAESTTYSSPRVPYVNVNRAADVLRMLTALIDSGTMTVQGIHGATDAADQTALPIATDPATGYALAIDLKTVYNLHRVKTAGGVHGAADSTNVVSAADADTEGKLITLSNQLKAMFNAHIILLTSATHHFSDVKELVDAADASDYAGCYLILNELRTKYNAHVIDIGCSVWALADTAAFTGANSLAGSKVTFGAATTTVALRNVVAYVVTNTVNQLNFSAALPAIPVSADVYTVEFSAIDSDLDMLAQGKGLGDSASNPHANGPSLINAIMKMIVMLGGALPSYLDIHSAEPFHIGSPSAGAGSLGHGGATLIADALQRVRDQVAAYTKPA